MSDKPDRGTINDWTFNSNKFGGYITGIFVDHPRFAGKFGHTSQLVNWNFENMTVETLNSKYVLGTKHQEKKSLC